MLNYVICTLIILNYECRNPKFVRKQKQDYFRPAPQRKGSWQKKLYCGFTLTFCSVRYKISPHPNFFPIFCAKQMAVCKPHKFFQANSLFYVPLLQK